MKKIYLSLIVLLLIFLQGCSATGPKFSSVSYVGPNETLIYVYRNSAFLKGGTYPFVYIDGEEIGPLKNGGYVKASVPPGEHRVTIDGQIFPGDWMQKPINLYVKTSSEKPTFIKLWLGNAEVIPASYITLASSNAAVVAPEYALEQIKECNYSD
jgi:hypothetical protein